MTSFIKGIVEAHEVDEASKRASTGAFHEGLREAMADTRSPAEIAILNDQRIAERRVIAEHDRPFDILVTAGAEFTVIREMARAMEAEGDTPVITWFRDASGQIAGVKLVGHLSRETQERSPEILIEPVDDRAPAPFRLACHAAHEGYFCTRRKAHKGEHIAHTDPQGSIGHAWVDAGEGR